MSDHDVCNTRSNGNHTPVTYILYAEYAGIPDNLMINVIAWVVLLLLFTILRKIAWDYGRIALVSRTEENSPVKSGDSGYNVWTSLFYGEHDRRSLVGSQESLDITIHSQDKGLCAWIPAFFRIKDIDILHKSGRDAVQYLSFQRYLLAYLVIICVLSISVVLPVNFQGTIIGNASDFGHTTIGNVESRSPLLWVHAVLAVVYLLLVVFMLRHFSINLEFDDDEQVSRTLMISNIPSGKCFQNIMKTHFREGYPEVVVIDISFAYNISSLISLDKKRERAAEAKIYSEAEYKKTGQRPMMRPHTCGILCCCCSNEVDAIEYYTEEVRTLTEKCEAEKALAYQIPLGIAFVTFQQDQMAEKIRADFRASCKGSHNPQTSSVYWELNVHEWQVKFAPAPENIYWENLSIAPWQWWIRAILINFILVLLLFFLTTPAILMTTIDQFNYKKAFDELHSPLLVQFLPTILLLLFSTLLPNLVYYSDQYLGHWTKTAEHHAVMRKTFIFLLLMVLILPSLGLTSAKAFFEWAMSGNQTMRWECIFLSGNGAFFVNYVTTTAFIGTALDLIRFSELFMYILKLCLARSAAEKSAVRKTVLWDFQFGCQYAWMLCIFAITIAYSIPCPLVTPFGLVYLGFKHLVDRYNIYFAYNPSKINKHIHASAINFVVVSVILLQVNIVFFTGLRAGYSSPVFIFSCIALFITLLVFSGRIGFGWFKHLSPIKYRKPYSSVTVAYGEENIQFAADDSSLGDGAPKPFVASVLLDKEEAQESNTRNTAASYGTMDRPVETEYSINKEGTPQED